MDIYPAIDILGGKAVRLYQGDFLKKQVYSDEPLGVALDFLRQGAGFLHIVDLDGARTGVRLNGPLIGQIAKETGLFIQAGGGVRSEREICALLEAGIRRVILGSAALENRVWTERMIKKYGDMIAVGVDAKGGMAAARGWTDVSRISAPALCGALCKSGLNTLIYTDISRDGTLAGIDHGAYAALKARFSGDLIASGGIKDLSDVKALKKTGVTGAIIGKAIYENKISLKEALALC